MFTGIVEELGHVVDVTRGEASATLTVSGPVVSADARDGASIAVSGVCLTVVSHGSGCFTADLMAETLDRTSLAALRPGDPVNLERAMRVDSRFGGHFVQGHVDDTATILERTPGERSEVVRFSLPRHLGRFVVEKGSITVDGVSLTVVSVVEGSFTVSLIPTTLALTTLGRKGIGEPVNLEVDILAKHVDRLLGSRA